MAEYDEKILSTLGSNDHPGYIAVSGSGAHMMDDLQRSGSQASALSRSIVSRTFMLKRRDNDGESSAHLKGPLGLSTLYQPANSVTADLIFVHGLGGGSRSTWTKSGDPSLYWPQRWLPQDPGFQDVRIHSFGYDSNLDKESTLNLHDFAKSLLGTIHDCPAISTDSNVRRPLRGIPSITT